MARARWRSFLSTSLLVGITLIPGCGSPDLNRPASASSPPVSVPVEHSGPTSDRPNVVMIAFDTVRADRMSSYDGPRPTTPNLDALAAQGSRFADCTAQAPFTPHSFSSMFASIYVADLPVRERARPENEVSVTRAGLEDFHTTLPEALRDSGYFTGAVVRGWFTEAFGLKQGFDWFAYKERDQPELPEVTRTATRWLQQWRATRASQPFFLFVYSVDVHYPFMKGRSPDAHVFGGDPEGFNIDREVLTPFRMGTLGESDVDLANALTLYDEGLHWADHEIQTLLDELDNLGVAENTIVVFVSDHGEEFGEHGSLSHGQNNFRTSVHVPLIIRAPGFPANNLVTTPVMNIDVMPTILDLCDIPVPETAKGLSLVPSMRGEPQPELEYRNIFSEGAWTGFIGLARAGDHSFLLDEHGNRFLFNLALDPEESHNLAAELPAMAGGLQRVLIQHKREGLGTQLTLLLHGSPVDLDSNANPIVEGEIFASPGERAPAPTLSEESIEQLKALGYLE